VAVVKLVHIVVGVFAVGLMSAAGLWGAWCWYRVRASPLFWRLLRAGQAVVVIEVALGGVLLLIGDKEPNLHLIYGLLPLAVSFIGELLRLGAAQSVLDKHGLASAQAVGELPEKEQRAIVISIMQRELGVMVLAAFVIVVLLIRAAGTAG
jgi:hypothetical protein